MFMKNSIMIVFSAILSIGCTSDYKLSPETEKVEPGIIAPEIDVNPTSYNFGALSAGSETQEAVISIKNIGNDILNLSSIYLHNGNSNFSITIIPTDVLDPNQSDDLIISYSPGTYEDNSDIISILSNDEDEPDEEGVLNPRTEDLDDDEMGIN